MDMAHTFMPAPADAAVHAWHRFLRAAGPPPACGGQPAAPAATAPSSSAEAGAGAAAVPGTISTFQAQQAVAMMSREQVLDRYGQHTAICPHCCAVSLPCHASHAGAGR